MLENRNLDPYCIRPFSLISPNDYARRPRALDGSQALIHFTRESDMENKRAWTLALLLARFALAAAFLSAVADRFGFWGQMGELGVSWGSMPGFYRHVAILCPWASAGLIPAIAWFVTILEGVLGVALLLGVQLPLAALTSAFLLLVFAVSMAAFHSVKLALNFSVLTCTACAVLLYLATARPSASASRA